MSGRVLIAIALAVGLVVVVVVNRAARRANAADPAFRSDWKAVRRARRREVALAVLRGRAVSDPRDAALALRFAGQVGAIRVATDRISSAMRVVDVAVGLAAAALAVYLAVTGGARAALLAAPFALLVVTGLARGRLLRTLRERVERSEEENRRLLEGVPRESG